MNIKEEFSRYLELGVQISEKENEITQLQEKVLNEFDQVTPVETIQEQYDLKLAIQKLNSDIDPLKKQQTEIRNRISNAIDLVQAKDVSIEIDGRKYKLYNDPKDEYNKLYGTPVKLNIDTLN